MSLTPLELAVVFVIILAGSALQGAVGYGLNLIAAPLLLLVDPGFVPGPLALASFVLVSLVTWREKHALDFRSLRWAILGTLAGMAAGSMLLISISQVLFSALFAVMILAAVGLSMAGWRVRRSPATLLPAGLIAGFMGILTTISGPPIALMYQDVEGMQLRSAISGFFLATAPVSLAILALAGRLGPAQLPLTLALLPGILLGYWLSRRIIPLVDRGYTRAIVLAIAALSAVAILISQVFGKL
jgi:uncharacterized membrane protein YfcA